MTPRAKVLLLEVSHAWIKLLEIHAGRDGLQIARAHLEAVDSQTVIAESLRTAMRTGKFSSLPLLCSIPRQLVNVRLLELPSIDISELHDMVELQVGRQTPYSMSEILSGYKLLGQTRQGTYTRVLLGIVQRSLVRERYYAVEDAGLTVDRMSISSEGVMNWLLYRIRKAPPEQATLLLDVDSYFTHMILVCHRKVIFTKSLLWGASQMPDGAGDFVQRVKEACRSCEDALQGASISKVLLSGARKGCTEEMASAIQDALGIPCERADALEDVKVATAAGAVLGDASHAEVSLTGLIGMALMPDSLALHFVPDVYAMRQAIQRSARVWSGFAAALVAFMLSGSLYLLLSTGYRMQHLRSLRADYAWLRPQVQQVERMVEVIRATRSRQESYVLPERVLPAVHASVPEGVYLSSFQLDVENRRFALSGTAPTRRDIRDLIRHLEETPYLQSVEEGGGTTMDNEQRFRFQVSGEVRGGLQ